MSEGVIIAILTLLGSLTSTAITLVVCLMNNRYQAKMQKAELENQKDAKLAELKTQSDNQMRDIKEDMIAHFQEMIATNTELAHQIEMLNVQFTDLDKKVEKHNHVVDRMYAAESAIKVIDEQIKVANHRIEDLESVPAK